MVKEDDPDTPHGISAQPQETLGSAGRPAETLGSAGKPDETLGSATKPGEDREHAPEPRTPPAPAGGGSRNTPLLVGGGIAILAILAIIITFVAR